MRRHLLAVLIFALASMVLVGATDGGAAADPSAPPGTTQAGTVPPGGGALAQGATSGQRADAVRESAARAGTSRPQAAVVRGPEEPVVLGTDEAAALARVTSEALFTSSPAVVVAAPGSVLRASSLAVALRVPLLLEGPEASAEITRLGARTVIGVGADETVGDAELRDLVAGRLGGAQPVAAGSEVAAVAALDLARPALLGPEVAPAPPAPTESDPAAPATSVPEAVEASPADPAQPERFPKARPTDALRTPAGVRPGADGTTDLDLGGLLAAEPPTEPVAGLVVMSTGDPGQTAAVATARAAGATVQIVPTGDPRATSTTVQETAANAPDVVVGLGTAFGEAATLAWRTATAATGTELPGGGQLVLPGKTYVALYGVVGSGALGVLGEQDAPATVARAREHADAYAGHASSTVVPALEIIATVASRGAGDDGDYSAERGVEELRPLVDLAHEHGQYVVLDLQPGRTDFLTQAKRYEELLRLPNVGLALDPEWRLRPDQVHLRQIGQVDVAEVNQVVTWLADLTRANRLPQKLLVLHQFQLRMVTGANDVDQSRSEIAVLVHVDGQGSQPAKQGTWAGLRAGQPDIRWWGWKNFYDEDVPMLSPEETMRVQPAPDFVSYQ